MTGPYKGRPQTKAKHYILKRYLQTLSFKVLSFRDELVYVDGFSGPWKSQTEDFSDTSFMIALSVLKDVQEQLQKQGRKVRIKCFFVEFDGVACGRLEAAVMPFHKPDDRFEVVVKCGRFEDAIAEIKAFMGRAFTLTFIDPTGWTGYSYDRIKPVLEHDPGEVLINFMYDHVNRFSTHPDPKIITSLDDILGGPGWNERLDPSLQRGPAIEKLFREVLRDAGRFKHSLSTRIDKATEDRPHFFIVYGTRNDKGLEAFRGVEYDALKGHEVERKAAKADKKAAACGTGDLFAGMEMPDESSFEALVASETVRARSWIVDHLRAQEVVRFGILWPLVLQAFVLRTTDVKQICAGLAREGVIENVWKSEGKRVPYDHHLISCVKPGVADVNLRSAEVEP